MGQDPTGTGFHDALLRMLNDASPMVRGNAALSLVRFGDASGRPQIVALLQPAHISSPQSGRIVDADRSGTAIHQGGLIAKLQKWPGADCGNPFANSGANSLGSRNRCKHRGWSGKSRWLTLQPSRLWEALRALYLVGQADDLPAVLPYERDLPDISNDVRQQAVETEKAIRERVTKPSN